MDNPEKISALSTQDTGQRQAKQKTQHRKLKKMDYTDQTLGVKPYARGWYKMENHVNNVCINASKVFGCLLRRNPDINSNMCHVLNAC